MIQYKSGDILADDAEALVNTVNCVGVMGRGIALQFNKAFQKNFEDYAAACKREEVQPGHMFVHERLTSPRFIINFPTKRHWRQKSRIEDIEAGLADLAEVILSKGIHSIAIPPLGCGLGGLQWPEVRARIEEALGDLSEEVRIVVYEPHGAPEPERMVKTKKRPDMTRGRAALVSLFNRYLAGAMDPFVTLLELHKLMYFLQEAGEQLRLEYVAGTYGPYAKNLRHVLNAIEGHYISGYADAGDAPGKPLELLNGVVAEADAYLESHDETTARIARVGELVEGFETPLGLELLATVHWVATRSGGGSDQELITRTHAWGERKRRFSGDQILLAHRMLGARGWLAEEPGSR